MIYKSALENVYVCISQDKDKAKASAKDIVKNTAKDKAKNTCDDKNKVIQIICANMQKKHNVIFNTTEGYRKNKDILISNKALRIKTGVDNEEAAGQELEPENRYISEDIGLGEEYTGGASYVVYDPEDITAEYCEHIYARKMHIPAYILETEHYIVREECEEDLTELYELYATLKDCIYIEQLYEAGQEKEFLRNYISNMYYFFDYGLWLVYDKHTGKLVGRIGIENRSIDGVNCQELGYLIGKEYQQKGVAYEVCSKVINYARERLGIESLYACIHKENIPSIRLITKLGFGIYAYDVEGMNIYTLKL